MNLDERILKGLLNGLQHIYIQEYEDHILSEINNMNKVLFEGIFEGMVLNPDDLPRNTYGGGIDVDKSLEYIVVELAEQEIEQSLDTIKELNKQVVAMRERGDSFRDQWQDASSLAGKLDKENLTLINEMDRLNVIVATCKDNSELIERNDNLAKALKRSMEEIQTISNENSEFTESQQIMRNANDGLCEDIRRLKQKLAEYKPVE